MLIHSAVKKLLTPKHRIILGPKTNRCYLDNEQIPKYAFTMFEFKKWEIRIANASDTKAACELFKSSVINICGPHYNNDQQILDYWNSNKTPEKVLSWIENKDFYFLVALNKGALEGVAFINEQTGELYAVYLIPPAVGFGLGQKMLELMLAHAAKKKLTKVFLKSSLNAQNFYEKRGFRIVGQDFDVRPPAGIPHFKMEILILAFE